MRIFALDKTLKRLYNIYIISFYQRCLMISYNKLWKLLIDKGMKKSDLREITGISTSSLAKLGRNEPVSLTILLKICNELECDIGDIMEVISEME